MSGPEATAVAAVAARPAVASLREANRLGTRSLFGRCAATVYLITYVREGVALGMTATSVCSVSLDPPSALICINREARTRGLIVEAGRFVINVLSQGQEEIANAYSRPGRQKAIAAGLLGADATADLRAGYPVLDGVTGALMCRLDQVVDFGSHSIMIGLVDRVFESTAHVPPLVYQDREYISPESLATLARQDREAGRLISALGW